MKSHYKSTSETKGVHFKEYPGKEGGEEIFATNSQIWQTMKGVR